MNKSFRDIPIPVPARPVKFVDQLRHFIGALNALVFLYKQFLGRELVDLRFTYSSVPKNIPVVFSHREASLVIDHLSDPYRLLAQLMYGAGLRISECCRLRVKDFDINAIS
ncbi:MAG: tyrosine-type recombinase/integrase [Pseudomonadales bacterium]